VGRDGKTYAFDLGKKGSGDIFAKGAGQATHLADAFAKWALGCSLIPLADHGRRSSARRKQPEVPKSELAVEI
jgi:hypothetical protein